MVVISVGIWDGNVNWSEFREDWRYLIAGYYIHLFIGVIMIGLMVFLK